MHMCLGRYPLCGSSGSKPSEGLVAGLSEHTKAINSRGLRGDCGEIYGDYTGITRGSHGITAKLS
eukprot:1030559-Amorphochlora_amoeboformis.AAC.2